MALISGTLTNAVSPLTKWVVSAFRMSDGALVISAQVSTTNESPVNYSMASAEAGPCLIVASPKVTRKWEPNVTATVGDTIAATNTPYLYEVTSVPTITLDPYLADVVISLSFETDFTDAKGHTFTSTGDQWRVYIGTMGGNFLNKGYLYCYQYPANWPNGNALISSSPDFVLGTGDFTIDMWGYTGQSESNFYYFLFGDQTASNGLSLHFAGSNRSFVVTSNNAVVISAGEPTSYEWHGKWMYISLQRGAGVLSLYIDGVNKASTTFTTDLSSQDVRLGARYAPLDPDSNHDVRISDLRVTKAARYTTNFTRPTGYHLTTRPAISGNSEPTWPETVGVSVVDSEITLACLGRMAKPTVEGLLYFQKSVLRAEPLSAYVKLAVPLDSDVLDTLNHQYWNTISDNGTACDGIVLTQKPLNQGYGSGYFSSADNNWYGLSYLHATDFEIGTGAFCMDIWINALDDGNHENSIFEVGNSSYLEGILLRYNSNTSVIDAVSDGSVILTAPIASTDGATGWHHIELSRDSGTLYLFVDGVMQASVSNTTNFSAQTGKWQYAEIAGSSSVGVVVVGGDLAGFWWPFRGWLADARLTIGVARHTTNFTPPALRIAE